MGYAQDVKCLFNYENCLISEDLSFWIFQMSNGYKQDLGLIFEN